MGYTQDMRGLIDEARDREVHHVRLIDDLQQVLRDLMDYTQCEDFPRYAEARALLDVEVEG